MFRGDFEHNINAQGRVSLPAPFRGLLEEDFQSKKIVLVGGPTHIEAFPEVVFKRMEEEDLTLDQDDPEVWNYLLAKRRMIHEQEYDGQGRIFIPKKMRERYGLEKEVVFFGFMNKILLFHPRQFEQVVEEAFSNQQASRARVAEMRARKKD